jgi:hypothetical protein
MYREPTEHEVELFCRPREVSKEQSLVLVVDNKPQFPAVRNKVYEVSRLLEGRDFANAQRGQYKEKGIVIKVKKNEKKGEEIKDEVKENEKGDVQNDIAIDDVKMKDDINNYEIEQMDYTEMSDDFGPIL